MLTIINSLAWEKIKTINKNKLVSVIIPVFNRERQIVKTLDSVYNQKYRPIEIIIVNDGSSDNSEKHILSWSEKHLSSTFNVLYFKQSNKGAPNARNYGIRKSNGDFIQFLDSDDRLHPIKIYEQVKALYNTKVDVAVCDFKFQSNKKKHSNMSAFLNSGDLHKKLSSFGSISIFTPLIRSSLLKNNLKWNEKLKKHQDIDFMLKLFVLIKDWIYTPGVWCYYHIHGNNQISDCYGSKSHYSNFPNSLLLFFLRNISKIPAKNYWMIWFAFFTLIKNNIRNNFKQG